MRHSQAWVVQALAVSAGLLLLPARSLAAEGDCSGRWHFEIKPPSPEQEAWLSPRSLCRSQSLTKSFDLEYRRDAPLPTMVSKSPYRPTEVLLGGGSCEFRFQTDDQPMRFGLAFEVPAKGAQVKGKVACSESEAGPDGKRSGMHLDLEVSATHTDDHRAAEPSRTGDVGTQAPERELQAVLQACREGKAEALWNQMTPRFRSEIDAYAARVAPMTSRAELRRLYKHAGPPEAFTGRMYLRYLVRSGNNAGNPCADSMYWKIVKQGPVGEAYVVAIERPTGNAFALRFLRDPLTWRLDQITQAVAKK
jgi:hypothetical protein